MASTQFKLAKLNGLTRRIHFPGTELPSWSALASKIESLYEIPVEKIGVAYVDSDGDEVTLSSDDELQDFYAAVHKPPEIIKFVVQDLGSLRHSQHADLKATSTPPDAHYRNTFGGENAVPLTFEVEDDWQRLPRGLEGLFGQNTSDSDGFFGAPDSPHAFIEVLDSDVNSVVKGAEDNADTSMESDLLSSLGTPTVGKGKNRAEMQPTASGVSSTGAILVAEQPVKLPVHVLDVGHEGMVDPITRVEASPPHPTIGSPIQTENTPVMSQAGLAAEQQADPEDTATDPPLPSIESDQPAAHPVSLTSDVAAFLSSLSAVFSSHPELSEGLRNITRNATNGTYWSAHREAMSRAAEELRQSATEESSRAAGELRRAEEEAGRRVAAALGGLMRLFGDISTGGEEGHRGAPTSNSEPDASSRPTTVDYGDLNSAPHPGAGTRTLGHSFPWGSHERFAPPPGPPPPLGPHGPPRHGSWGPMPPHPPPPPLQGHHGPFGPPLGPPHRAHWGTPFWARPPPPGGRNGNPPFASGRPFWGPPAGPNETSTPPDPVGPQPGPSSTAPLSSAEMRAKVEIAKQNYKREKEMFRRAREERKAAEQKQGTK